MIDNIQYSEKEIEIFNGLIHLISEGANPYTIKVSDIAEAANVGKGTIYDYFQSKEEAISKAIIYNIVKEANIALKRIKSKNTFKERYYEVLQTIIDGFTNLCTLKMLMYTGGLKEFYEYLVDDKYDISKFMSIFNEEAEELIQLGFKEGIIKMKESKYYQTMVIQGTISAFSHYISRRDLYENMTLEEAKDTSYKILVKSLN